MRTIPALRHRPVLVLAGLLAAVALAACGGDGGGSQTPDLAGKTFESTSVSGHELVDGTTITLTFEEDRLGAYAGCNTMTGGASWEGGTLQVEALAQTMMACEDDLAAQDQWLLELLEDGPAVSLDGDELTVGDSSRGITLTRTSG